MQALAGVRVEQIGIDDQDVVALQTGQYQSVLRLVVGHVDVAAVQHDAVEGVGDDVDERGGTRSGRGELDGGPAAEGPLRGQAGAVGQVQFHVVGLDVQQFRTYAGVVSGEVRDS